MGQSKSEEVIGILWLILAFVASEHSTSVALLAGGLGILSLIAAFIFAWQSRKASQ